MTQEDNNDLVSTGLRKTLNMHGYGFQYSVLHHAIELFSARQSAWLFDGAEYPVVAGNDATHIDFILRTRSSRTYLVCECKRVDPAKSYWCFSQAPYTWRNQSSTEVVFDRFKCMPANICIPHPSSHFAQTGVYHIGFEQKTAIPGDGSSHGGSAINEAVTQVLRGSSGLINHLFDYEHRRYENENWIRIIPAIFTTAQLWVTDTDLGNADLKTGNLSADDVKAKKVDWLWFNHNRSPRLGHNIQAESYDSNIDLSTELKNEFTRSVAIIGPDGIDRFLTRDLEHWLN